MIAAAHIPLISIVSLLGNTARFVTKYKPRAPIIVVTPNESVARQLLICGDVWPVVAPRGTEQEMTSAAIEFGKRRNWLQQGSSIVLVAGVQMGVVGSANMMKILDVE